MYIILGATGHVGSAAAAALLDQGEAVTVVTRDADNGAPWAERGAKVAVADVRDVAELRAVLQTGKRAFLLNPPADPAIDTDVVERETVHDLLAAVAGSGLEKIVAESTFAARPGDRLGDSNTLYELEAGLKAQSIPTAIIRAAFYFSNWDMQLAGVRQSGALQTMYPPDLKFPMVSPDDLGRTAARLLTGPVDATGTFYVEGPELYSSTDVAEGFAKALGRPVELEVIPREQWEAAYKKLGFSDAAAHSYARMNAILVDGDIPRPEDPIRGTITLQDHIAELVDRGDDGT